MCVLGFINVCVYAYFICPHALCTCVCDCMCVMTVCNTVWVFGIDVCVCGLSAGLANIAVLHTQHHVGAGAAAGFLPEDPLPSAQRGGLAPRALVTQPPRLAVALHLPLPPTGGAMPQHLLRPWGGDRGGVKVCLGHQDCLKLKLLLWRLMTAGVWTTNKNFYWQFTKIMFIKFTNEVLPCSRCGRCVYETCFALVFSSFFFKLADDSIRISNK